MKTLLASWIIYQLLVIGMASVSAHNKIIDKTYVCNERTQKISVIYGAVFPLALFVPENSEMKSYCNY